MIERFAQMPSALREHARWVKLGPAAIPALIVHPHWEKGPPVPLVLWMHGRTANKELDPGRYLRWMRAGIGTCAIDLPGHGERLDPELQHGTQTPKILRQMIGEIDSIIDSLRDLGGFHMTRLGIGGMSAGGMAAMSRLCKPHPFFCASVEAATGSWESHFHPSITAANADLIRQLDPISHLAEWKEIPFQAFHARHDEMVSFHSQESFVESLRRLYRDDSLIEFITYDQTGAPGEHIGFGKHSADAKDRQRDFFRKWLLDPQS